MTDVTASVISNRVSLHGSHLRGFLARVRMISLRREAASWAGWAVVLMTAVAGAATLVTATSLRGDLVAGPALALALGALATTGLRRASRFRARMGTLPAVARTLVARASPAERPDLGELLAALELADLLDHGANLPSPELAGEYVRQVDTRVAHTPPLAPPPSRATATALAAALSTTAAFAAAYGTSSWFRGSLDNLLATRDARPPPPPQPLWDRLDVAITYPEYTRRPRREVINPSGPLRVPAGSRIDLKIDARDALSSPRILADLHGVLEEHPVTRGEEGTWRGALTVTGPTAWSLLATDVDGQLHRSPVFQIEVEPDARPELELLPLAANERDVTELDRVEVRFRASDDFGLGTATLVYANPEGEPVRLDAGTPPQSARQWSHRYTWDLSAMPVADRETVEFWIEIRDNDPGYGLMPRPPTPGKVSESTHLRLTVRDRESIHATNLTDLQGLRDAAVDHLAHRLLTAAFGSGGRDERSLDDARSLHHEAAAFLAALASMIDRLGTDTLTRERDVAALTAIHRRLFALHRVESELHDRLPPGAEATAPARVHALLAGLAGLHPRQVQQLEDEVIRLDDLVDNLHIDRIEILADRLQAAQQRLVEVLERLRAGDRSVEGEIEPLHQRIREYLRKIADARAQLQKEVGHEFMNLDALRNLQAQMEHEDLAERLRRNDIDGALEEARGALDQLRQLRDTVQERMANQATTRLTPEESARMALLRELSRIVDEERGLRGESRDTHQAWRDAARAAPADAAKARARARRAEEIRRSVDTINDARLGRDGRKALEDAAEALERASAATGELERYEEAAAAARALRRAVADAAPGEAEAKALRPLVERADRLADELRSGLPRPQEIFDEAAQTRLDELARRQSTLRDRAAALLDADDAQHLPDVGKDALRRAITSMEHGREQLRARASEAALEREEEAISGLQRAIDSLRAATPPPRSAPGTASTESERDRTLRDELLDAMRESPPDGFGEPVKRYYEELLR